MGLFSELHIAWLAARIRELAMTPIEPSQPKFDDDPRCRRAQIRPRSADRRPGTRCRALPAGLRGVELKPKNKNGAACWVWGHGAAP